jgi:hypothetical protein
VRVVEDVAGGGGMEEEFEHGWEEDGRLELEEDGFVGALHADFPMQQAGVPG